MRTNSCQVLGPRAHDLREGYMTMGPGFLEVDRTQLREDGEIGLARTDWGIPRVLITLW